ncbi:MAG: hypothetical protein DYG88_14740 [Chloroflexi bacterium CFX4]|nr:hypothetical protein [Chloroflexi bacterium CFX4]
MSFFTAPLNKNDFDERDLSENHEGRLSERQVRRVRQNGVVQTGIWLSVAAFSLLVAVFAIVRDNALAMFAAGTFGALMVALASVTFTRMRDDVHLGQVARLEGPIKLNITAAQYTVSYSVKIGRRTFGINQKLLLSLRDGDHYTVYYAPKSGILLAIEPSLPLEQVKDKRKLMLGDDGELVPLDELTDNQVDSLTERGSRT